MHRLSRRKASFALAAALVGPTEIALAQAPAWPQKPIKPVLLGPQALREVMDEEITRYRAAVARTGMRLD